MTEAESMQADESLKSSVKSAKSQVDGLKELVPQQLSDEVKLATTVLKGKGIRLGTAAALAGAALLLVLLFVIAVVVTLVNVLAIWLPGWAAALIIAGFFLLVAAILGLVGYAKIKKALPLKPEAAIRGLRHDFGVLKDGSGFDVSTLDEPLKKKSEEDDDKDKKKEPKPPAPSADELILRTRRRRRQIQALRDNLGESVQAPLAKIDKVRTFTQNAGDRVSGAAAKARGFVRPSSSASEDQSEADRVSGKRAEQARPYVVMAGSTLALGAVIRALFKRS
ncbi:MULTISPECIES: phage holin family protein [Micrococcaceae]|uniref:phage holin family protein n=1 Tax=Micrococcaceae TaxID=1268 RepID=UPI001036271A|nr:MULTISPECIES: phage holin family protein [Micrococcaceae]TAP25721.1 phage holin family protein [Arthrobacter sp. S41]UXN31657.1 phage holin family protein [Glutamicibacter sp. M10]